jgi:site-specific recombinase XerC
VSTLAPTLQAFFTDRLARQRQASDHTIAAYRDTWRLLLVFTQQRTGKAPSAVNLADLDAPLIGAFLKPFRNRPRQQRANSQRPPRGYPLAVPVCRAAPPRRCRRHSTRAGDST